MRLNVQYTFFYCFVNNFIEISYLYIRRSNYILLLKIQSSVDRSLAIEISQAKLLTQSPTNNYLLFKIRYTYTVRQFHVRNVGSLFHSEAEKHLRNFFVAFSTRNSQPRTGASRNNVLAKYSRVAEIIQVEKKKKNRRVNEEQRYTRCDSPCSCRNVHYQFFAASECITVSSSFELSGSNLVCSFL